MSVDLKQIYKRLLGTMWVNKPLKDICVIPQPTASGGTHDLRHSFSQYGPS